MTAQPPLGDDDRPAPGEAGPREAEATGAEAAGVGVLPGPRLVVRRAVFIGVLVLVALSVPASVLIGFRAGGYVLAAALVGGGLARALLPEYLCLGLLVRSRQQDTVTLLLLGVAVLVSARIVPTG